MVFKKQNIKKNGKTTTIYTINDKEVSKETYLAMQEEDTENEYKNNINISKLEDYLNFGQEDDYDDEDYNDYDFCPDCDGCPDCGACNCYGCENCEDNIEKTTNDIMIDIVKDIKKIKNTEEAAQQLFDFISAVSKNIYNDGFADGYSKSCDDISYMLGEHKDIVFKKNKDLLN